MDDDRAIPPAPSLEQELRAGLHVGNLEETTGGIGPKRASEVGRFVRCAQAAMLRLAEVIHQTDNRRAAGEQRLHDRLSAVTARLAVVERQLQIDEAEERGRTQAERDQRDRESNRRESRKLLIAIAAILIALPATLIVLAQIMGALVQAQ